MMLVAGPHRNLYATLNNMLDEKGDPIGRKSKASNDKHRPAAPWVGKKLKAKSIGLHDFGSKINIVVLQEPSRSRIDLQVSLQKGYTLHKETITHLKSLYGPAVAFSDSKSGTSTDVGGGTMSFSVTVNDAVGQFDSTQSCVHSLSQIRIQAAGAPILNALHRIDTTPAINSTGTSTSLHNTKDYIYNLGSHGMTGSYHCISSSSKVMMVYRVCFEDEMERSLARLFLQEFQNTQTKVAVTPYCEYRRPNDMTEEMKRILADDAKSQGENVKFPPTVGLLTLTFFPSSTATEERRQKAVELLVNFLPYVDRHVKSTKSMMLSRMRIKRNDLLCAMKEPSSA
jgi:Arp2/3 complex, 34 kD subunit p34-Arc